jgi:hypothetical protein
MSFVLLNNANWQGNDQVVLKHTVFTEQGVVFE